jgi:hypothetical protein
MKYIPLILLLLAVACSKPSTESTASADSLKRDTVSIAIINETSASQTPGTESDETESQEAEDPINDALMMYGGEYTLDSSSEAEDGSSLTLTYKSGSTFTISITKMVADFCSGTLEAEITFDENNVAKFDGDGHPVTVKLVNKTVVVEDPERQLGVGTCEFNGTFLNIVDGIN